MPKSNTKTIENINPTIPRIRLTFDKTVGNSAVFALEKPIIAKIIARSEVSIANTFIQGIKATIIETIANTKAAILKFSPAFDRELFSIPDYLVFSKIEKHLRNRRRMYQSY